MNYSVHELGRNARIIWDTLHENGIWLTQIQLQKLTNLSDDAFYGAIGWLARENKISRIGMRYCLGDSNLAQKIGTNASKIGEFLNSHAAVNLATLTRWTDIDESDVIAAIGWLAKENKIETSIGTDHNILYRLKNFITKDPRNQ